MAPLTRSTRQAAGVNRKAPARKARSTRTTQEEPSDSWDLRNHSHDSEHERDRNGTGGSDMDNHYNGSLVVASREPADVDEALHPLREMAERVGREVETFAENLDCFLEQLPTSNKFDAILDLVDEFKSIAQDAASALQKSHQRERAQMLRKEWSEQANISGQKSLFARSSGSKLGSSMSDKKAEELEQLRQWQQEADLWELFRLMLKLHHNPDKLSIQEEKEDALRGLGQVHRYTSEREIWDRFLIQDDLAKERFLVKTWLEQTVDHQESDLAGIMEELETKAGRGSGLWSHGWVDTREKIKGEKRLRSWPNTPGAPLPHLKRSDNSELLVTALDPDAISRQERTLEKPDGYFERAMWIACWEMLRRGKSWEEVSEWCQQRNEGWRAISIGQAAEPNDILSKAAWRNMCFLASQSGFSNEYEAAVYGLLGGNAAAAQRVCRSVDDKIYAHCSATLIRQFDQYLASNYATRLLQTRIRPTDDSIRDPQEQMIDLALRLRHHPSTFTEAYRPLKIIQSYLLANDMGSMIHVLGYAIAFTDRQRTETEDMIIHLTPFWTEQGNQPEAELALDLRTLRMSVHIAIFMRILSNKRLNGDERDAEENVIVAYIQALRAAGKRDLIPAYASRLSLGRCVVSMARILEDVTSVSEQQTMLGLLRKYDLDVMLIINEQLGFLLNEILASGLQKPKPLHMLEQTNETHLYPGQRIIAGFLPNHIAITDDAIVQSIQWFNLVEGYWNETFHALALAVRKCLVAGRIVCALTIVHDFKYEEVSSRKSFQVLKKTVNLMEYEGPPPANQAALWNMMKEKSRTYYELEQLVNAIKAFSNWRELEADWIAEPASLRMSSAPAELKEAKDVVDERMAPILNGDILNHPVDEDEAIDLAFIRQAYLPEMILAYNTVLHTAGAVISRDNLLQSMDLAVTVADEDNKLTQCFIDSGRMSEMVLSFAQSSKAMITLNAGGKPWKPKKDREGKELGIWEIGPQAGSLAQTHEVSPL